MRTFKQFISEGPLSPIPAQTGLKRNFFHGNYGGFGNRGGAPKDRLDAAFQKHDTGYHYSKSPKDKAKHDRSLVRATKQLRKDKSLPLSTRAKAGAANLYFRSKLALQKESEARIPRKEGQPAGSKQHSDLYTDENPKGTIHGLKFATTGDAKASVSKIKNSGRSHAHKIQAAVAMGQRAKVMGKTGPAGVYNKFINAMKKKTKEMREDWSNKYKKSIDCSNPKGFSQKAHCRARKLRSAGIKTKSKPVR